MTLIPQWIDEIKQELNPDGSGYHVGEAADLLVERARRDCGFLNAECRDLMRAGAVVRIKEHDMTARGRAPRGKREALAEVIDAIAGGQGDFAEFVEGFSWLDQETSLDDAVDAIRKAYRDLTLVEAKQVVKLKRKKAEETNAAADRIQDFIDDHPEWATRPDMTMGEIAGLD